MCQNSQLVQCVLGRKARKNRDMASSTLIMFVILDTACDDSCTTCLDDGSGTQGAHLCLVCTTSTDNNDVGYFKVNGNDTIAGNCTSKLKSEGFEGI